MLSSCFLYFHSRYFTLTDSNSFSTLLTERRLIQVWVHLSHQWYHTAFMIKSKCLHNLCSVCHVSLKKFLSLFNTFSLVILLTFILLIEYIWYFGLYYGLLLAVNSWKREKGKPDQLYTCSISHFSVESFLITCILSTISLSYLIW